MANPPLTATRLFLRASRVSQTTYICPTCRLHPAARHTRRLASSNAKLTAKSTAAADKALANPFEGLETQDPSLTRANELDISQLAPVEPSDSQVVEQGPGQTKAQFHDPNEDPDYVPATTWEGLERVGTKSWLQTTRDPVDPFQGWSKPGRPEITTANIDALMDHIVDSTFEGQEILPDTPSITTPEVRLKLLSSIARITGVRLSDFQMQSASTIKDIRHMLLNKPKSRLFSEISKTKFQQTPNVQIKHTRRTAVNKDEAKGKWKLIVKGLQERGLPVHSRQLTRAGKLL